MGHKMGFGKSESLKPVIVFDVLAYVERVGKSDVFPKRERMEYGEWTGILRSKSDFIRLIV